MASTVASCDFAALLKQVQEAHEGEVAALRAEVANAKDGELEPIRVELQAVRVDLLQTVSKLEQERQRSAPAIDHDTEMLEISGATGDHADLINGQYAPVSGGFEHYPMWRKRDYTSDAWLLRFGDGHWAVSRIGIGQWMVASEPGAPDPTKVAKWEVNTGDSWDPQDSVKVSPFCESAEAVTVRPANSKVNSTSAEPAWNQQPAGGRRQKVHDGTSVEHPTSSAEDRRQSVVSVESQNKDGLAISNTTSNKVIYDEVEEVPTSKFQAFVRGRAFELFFACFIIVTALLICAEVQYNGTELGAVENLHPKGVTRASEIAPEAPEVFKALHFLCGVAFAIECLFKVAALRLAYVYDKWNWLDATMVVLWVFDTTGVDFGLNPNTARLLRLAKLLRLVRLVRTFAIFESLFVMIRSIHGSVSILGWAFIVIFSIQMFCALILYQVLHVFYFENDENPIEERSAVWMAFGTFIRAMFSMFELTLANWTPLSRMMAENVSEWFLPIACFYKLSMGFAVVGVVNGIFMQETFRVASEDDGIMVSRRARMAKSLRRKMNRLFEATDVDGDGGLSFAELKSVLSHDAVKLWLSAMELDTSDLDTLFTLLGGSHENQNDLVTVDELISSVAALKGPAKSIDLNKLMLDFEQLKKHIKGGPEQEQFSI